jgi:hypothetical protein
MALALALLTQLSFAAKHAEAIYDIRFLWKESSSRTMAYNVATLFHIYFIEHRD